MARQIVSIFVMGVLSGIWGGGCVSVDTPNTKVDVGLTSVQLPGQGSSNRTPYAKPLERVSRQQAKLGRELAKQDWADVLEESSELMADVRTLSGYAGTSHDPATFRVWCGELLEHAQAVREAALVRDAAAAERALAAGDQVLSRMMQTFPLTGTPGQAVSASPPPTAAPSAEPASSRGEQKPLVP